MKSNILFTTCLFLALAGCQKPDMTVKVAPGTAAVSTTANYLNNNFDFSIFAAALAKTGLSDSLNSLNKVYTVFAVTNAGFKAMNIYTAVELDKWSADSLRHFIKTHVIAGRIAWQDFPSALDTRYTNRNGDALFISVFQSNLAVNGVKVKANPVISGGSAGYGISLLNGIVYPVDAAIKASSANIQAFLSARPDMTIFVAALKKFRLWDAMMKEDPLTVLAVPDSVFLRYGITADWINAVDTNHYKKVFMDCYILRIRVFQSDLYSFVDLTNDPLIPITFPPELLVHTTEPGLALCMRGYYFNDYPFGCFVYDLSKLVSMPDESGGLFWFYQILGPNATNYPKDGDPMSGYQVPYVGESNKAGSLKGTYLNYTLNNGVVHLLSGLLLTPDDVKR